MKRYERAGKLFKLFGWLTVIFGAIGVAAPFFLRDLSDVSLGAFAPLIPLVIMTIGVAFMQFKVGSAIIEHKDWARKFGTVLAILQMIGFPIGTILGPYMAWCLIKGWDD